MENKCCEMCSRSFPPHCDTCPCHISPKEEVSKELPKGVCPSCWGKKYYTQIHGEHGYPDFIGDKGFEESPSVHKYPCSKCNGTGKFPSPKEEITENNWEEHYPIPKEEVIGIPHPQDYLGENNGVKEIKAYAVYLKGVGFHTWNFELYESKKVAMSMIKEKQNHLGVIPVLITPIKKVTKN